jgi:predicted XRE-type DNA-binding protein
MKITAKFENVRRTEPAPTPAPRSGSAARNLALAYRVTALIDQGQIADYTTAAKLLGVSQPRLTHLMSLTMLAPTLQEAILAGTIAPGDKQLRRLARIAEWRAQLAALPNLGTTKSEGHAPDVPAAGTPVSVPERPLEGPHP